MRVEFDFETSAAAQRMFLSWRPVRMGVRLVDPPPGAESVEVTLASSAGTGGGRLSLATQLTHQGTQSLDIALPADGSPVHIWAGGRFGFPSAAWGDVSIDAVEKAGGAKLGSRPLMVRVRKDANSLIPAERDRFLAALATLNGRGTGRFGEFREMHVSQTLRESHGDTGFLPWHRAYILDLERELQAIDDQVALPYWRFDRPAPRLFGKAFMGLPDRFGRVQFRAGHPLLGWVTEQSPGIVRVQAFAPSATPRLRSEAQTIGLGGDGQDARFGRFTEMERDPHGQAHVSFGGGLITNPATAPRDPVFFLLHCNVDRLWAKWQWLLKRHDPADIKAFEDSARGTPGHRRGDTLWPWNGVTSAPRPPVAPGGGLADSPIATAPGPSPTVDAMIDYLAVTGGEPHGFAYDDVPFET